MQFDIVVIFAGILLLFFTLGLTIVFNNFFREIGGRIRELFEPEIQVKVNKAVHKFDEGLFLHSIHLTISNTTETETRIDNITVFDKRKRELRPDTSGYYSSRTEFNLDGSETIPWFGFHHREPTGETDLVKLRLAIERTGKRTIWIKFESRQVTPGQFPARGAF